MTPLTCSFGTPWLTCLREGPCAGCQAETDAAPRVYQPPVRLYRPQQLPLDTRIDAGV